MRQLISYRSITQNDCDFILKHWVGDSIFFKDDINLNELLSIIDVWSTKTYNGKYFEVFGILNNDTLIGMFSLYQVDNESVSLGIEIDIKNRQKGFATTVVKEAIKIAKLKGYQTIVSQALIDNAASVKLHARCGFKIINKALTKNGNKVYNYILVI